MKAEKDPKTGKWLIQYRFTDWQGKRRKSTKRGFATKREAEEWLRTFLVTQKADFDMKFEEFLKMYYADMETRLREHTMRTKKYIIDLKILPYFGQKRVNDITAADIRRWQNELIKDCLLMTPAGFDPVIPLFKFRVLFGFDQGIGDLDKKRFQITAGAGDPPGFYFLVALVFMIH